MNVREIAAQIVEAFPECRACGQLIDCWPAADGSAPHERLMFVAQEKLFAGICSLGHINEFYLDEAKEGQYVPHDITERTIGRFVSQDECGHDKHVFCQIKEGDQVPSVDGLVIGPAIVKFCGLCGMRKLHEKKVST